MAKVNVGVLGSGEVGKKLAGGFLSLGHEVMIGSRDPEKLREWTTNAGDRASAGTFEETAKFGDLIVLATHGAATVHAIELAGKSNFDHKVIIDATNPLVFCGGKPMLSVGWNDSLGEQIQRAVPNARVVKAFNTLGNEYFIKPDLPGGPPTMFIAGNDDESKRLVTQICDAFGWDTADLGGIESARYLEPMCMAWVAYGVRSNSWDHAFKLLKK